MRDEKFESQIKLAASEPRRGLADDFTASVVQRVQITSPRKLFMIKEWIMKTRIFLHRAPLVFGILAAAIVVILGGAGTYAVRKFFLPEVKYVDTKSKNEFDTKELGFAVTSCGSDTDSSLQRYGVLEELNSEDVRRYVASLCEQTQAQKIIESHPQWMKTSRQSGFEGMQDYYIGMNQQIKQIEGTRMTVIDPSFIQSMKSGTSGITNDEVLKEAEAGKPATVASDAKVYVNGQLSSISSLRQGDRIAVLRDSYLDSHNKIRDGLVRVIVKMELQDDELTKKAQHSVFAITPCEGNQQSLCVAAPGMALVGHDFLPNPSEGGNRKVRKDVSIEAGTAVKRQIIGRMSEISSREIKIKAFGSNQIYTIGMTQAARDASVAYHGAISKAQIGDAVQFDYIQAKNDNPLIVKTDDISRGIIVYRGTTKQKL